MSRNMIRRRVSSRGVPVGVGLLLGALVLGPAALGVAAAPSSGTIWTTAGDCSSPNPQDQNQYSIGDTVVIRGSNFSANTQYSYTITGQPGGASNDPGIQVAGGNVTTDGSGGFCVVAYTVAADDGGTYKVDAGGKQDNYSVNAATPTPSPTPTPTPVPTPTPTPVPTPTPTPTPTPSPTPTPAASPTPTPASSPTPTPTGGSGGSTDAPTSPPTDTVKRGSVGGDSLALVLVGFAAFLAVTLVLTPKRRE